VQLFATAITKFCQIGLELCIYLVQWHGLVINLNGQIVVLITITIYYIIKLVLIVSACETGKNQTQEIRITIHDVLIRAKDEQIKDKVVK